MFFATVALFGGLGIAASAIARFYFYGGFKALVSVSAVEPGSVALWALTHLFAIFAALVVCVGIVRKTNLVVGLGSVGFVGICLFAWAWPMDFLWFGATR